MDVSSRSTSELVTPTRKRDDDVFSAYKRIGCIFGGVIEEYSRRSSHLISDITDGWNRKTVSSALFMFFATLFSTVALGEHIREHHHMIGVKEYLLMNAAAGMFFSVFSCQPLMILRPTGPITLILVNLINISSYYEVDFWTLLTVCGYSVGIIMTLIAAFELSRFVRYLTRFTHEIFTCFVCSIYVYGGVHDVLANFYVSGDSSCADDSAKCDAEPFGTSLFMLVLALVTFLIAACITYNCNTSTSTKHPLIPVALQRLLVDYAVTIAVIVATLLSFWPRAQGADITVHRVRIPDGITPTAMSDTGEIRPWLTHFNSDVNDLGLVTLLGVAASLPIVFFFYIDQNLSSQLSQAPHMTGMQKGVYLHSPFLVVAICNFAGPMFGLPFVTASLPHSPQFVAALTDKTESVAEMDDTTRTCSSDNSPHVDFENHKCSLSSLPQTRRYIEKTKENRLAPFLVYFLIGIVAVSPATVRMIPLGAVRGVLAYIGAAGFVETELFRRMICLLRPPEQMRVVAHWKHAQNFEQTTDVDWKRIHIYTAVQVRYAYMML